MVLEYLSVKYCKVCNIRCDYIGKNNLQEIKTAVMLNKISSLNTRGFSLVFG